MAIRPKKEIQKRGAGGISEADYVYFTSGDFFEAENYEIGKSEEELRMFWEKHRQAILERYMNEMRAKGWIANRPWYFWKVDMVESRLKTPPGEFDAQKVWDHHRNIYNWVETDFAYLKRLGLLEPWELESKKVAK
jgi:hypothetical protein